MKPDRLQVDVVCPDCHGRQVWGLEAAIRALVQAGRFRRKGAPDPGIVFELLFTFAGQLPCPRCRHAGLCVAWSTEEDDGDWLEARLCERCRKPIPAERLQAVPEAVLCVRCQENEERAETAGSPPLVAEEVEYCPRCGAPMRLTEKPQGGLTRYRLVCSDYPQCRG